MYKFFALLVLGFYLNRFTGFAGRTLVSPFYPEYVERFGISFGEVGLLLSVFYIGYAAMQIPSGLLSDRYSPNRVLALALVGHGLASLLFVFASNWAMALTTRALLGAITAFMYAPAIKIMAGEVPQAVRGRIWGIGELGVSSGMIFTLAVIPLLSQLIAYRWLFIMLAFLGPTAALIFFARDRQGRSPTSTPTAFAPKETGTSDWRAVLKPAPLLFVACAACALFAMNGLHGWLSYYLESTLGNAKALAGVLLAVHLVFYFCGTILSGLLIDRLGRRKPVVLTNFFLFALFLGSLALNLPLPVLVVVVALAGLTSSCGVTPLMMLSGELVGSRRAGTLAGLVIMVAQTASAIATVSFGRIYSATGSFSAVWMLAMGVALFGFVLITMLPETGPAAKAKAVRATG